MNNTKKASSGKGKAFIGNLIPMPSGLFRQNKI